MNFIKNNYYNFCLFLVKLLLLLTINQKSFADDDKIVTKFIYNFSDLILDNRSLCSYGYDEVVSILKNNYNTIHIRDKDLFKVDQYCKLIYIASNKEKYISNIINKIADKAIPTISVIEDFDEYGTFKVEISRYGVISVIFDSNLIFGMEVEFSEEIFRFN